MTQSHITHIIVGILVWLTKSYKDALAKQIDERIRDVIDNIDYHFVGKDAIIEVGSEIISPETNWFFGFFVNRKVPRLLTRDLRQISPNTRWQIKYIGKNKFFAKRIATLGE